MVSVIIAAHGKLSGELLNSAEMILGKQDNVDTLTFIPGENTEDLKAKYNKSLEKFKDSSEVLIVVDLFGGSPYNAAFEIAMTHKNVEVLTGASMPMMLEIFSARLDPDVTVESIKKSINENKNGYIHSFKESLKNVEEEDEL